MKFQPGQSGNPSGRPKIPPEVRERALAKSLDMLNILISLAESEETPHAVRKASADSVLDRGLGKPAAVLGDEDGNPLDWIAVIAAARDRRASGDLPDGD